MIAGDYIESLAMLSGDCDDCTATSKLIVSSDNQLNGDMISAKLTPTCAQQKRGLLKLCQILTAPVQKASVHFWLGFYQLVLDEFLG